MRLPLIAALSLALGACVPTYSAPPPAPTTTTAPVQPARAAAETFLTVVSRVEPVAERYCRDRGVARNCDFRIVIDDRPGQPPNAFQTLDSFNRPVIGFTLALIADARNPDELAFVLGHEAAHHIDGHIPKRQDQALSGAPRRGNEQHRVPRSRHRRARSRAPPSQRLRLRQTHLDARQKGKKRRAY